MKQKIIETDYMDAPRLAAWNKLFNVWVSDVFRPALRALDYKQDCIQCGDIYFVTRFFIDKDGHVKKYEIVREEIDCNDKTVKQNDELKASVSEGFGEWIFPAVLGNIVVEARMGEVTRC